MTNDNWNVAYECECGKKFEIDAVYGDVKFCPYCASDKLRKPEVERRQREWEEGRPQREAFAGRYPEMNNTSKSA